MQDRRKSVPVAQLQRRDITFLASFRGKITSTQALRSGLIELCSQDSLCLLGAGAGRKGRTRIPLGSQSLRGQGPGTQSGQEGGEAGRGAVQISFTFVVLLSKASNGDVIKRKQQDRPFAEHLAWVLKMTQILGCAPLGSTERHGVLLSWAVGPGPVCGLIAGRGRKGRVGDTAGGELSLAHVCVCLCVCVNRCAHTPSHGHTLQWHLGAGA